MNDFESKLVTTLDYIKESTVKEAMLYSLTAGGKRLRPRLLFEAVKGFDIEVEDLDELGVAIEMIHTYSLIHDDLPAMDDDELRRGGKTCHIEFDEATAILAGDALLTESFNVVSRTNLSSDKLIKCIRLMSDYSGANGMIYGQEIDIKSEGENPDFTTLQKIHHYKTGALISLPLQMACVISNKFYLIDKFKDIGFKLGLAFQIQDDILDVTSTSDELGKSNSDVKNLKTTSITTLGLEEATNLMNELYNDIKDELNNIEGFDSKYILELIDKLIDRRK